MQKAKEATARIVIWKEMGITNTFTLEASFCGPDQGRYADYHFNIEILEEVGHKFCETILDFCDPDQIKVKQVLEEFEVMLPKASDSESDMESEPDSGENISENEGMGGVANESRVKKKIAKGKKGASQRAN